MEDPRVTKCLSAKRESKSVEFKEHFFPTDARQSLEVLKDIVAICNSGGGTLAVGINNAGEACGADVKAVLDYDHAKYCDLIRKYTMQNFTDFEVIGAEKNGHRIAVFLINAAEAPLVFEKPGTYPVDNNRQQTVFAQGTVFFRHGAKTESGTTDDLRKFINQRIKETQDQLIKGMRKVSEAPRGSHLEIVPRGTIEAKELNGSMPVRMTNNPNAQGVVAVDRHLIFPYRQKDLINRIKESLADGSPVPNTYDLQTINRVYNIPMQDNLSWKPQFSARQYSDAFVEWIVDKITKAPDFLHTTRQRFYEMTHDQQ
jgi:hypothetical protein